MQYIFRSPWYKRLLYRLYGRKPGVFLRTVIFDEPVTVRKDDVLTTTYTVKQ